MCLCSEILRLVRTWVCFALWEIEFFPQRNYKKTAQQRQTRTKAMSAAFDVDGLLLFAEFRRQMNSIGRWKVEQLRRYFQHIFMPRDLANEALYEQKNQQIDARNLPKIKRFIQVMLQPMPGPF